ncbi:Leucine-rich repeat domain superfamily [Sesbania bispinosa]|nr:Leucine-rich repeat domain superfamily [Sesbania bispinosa]
MTGLKRLHILHCPQLLSLPSGMHHLTALEELVIYGCPELCQKCQPQSGEYWHVLSHIKGVFIGDPTEEEGMMMSSNLKMMRLEPSVEREMYRQQQHHEHEGTQMEETAP